MAIDFVLSPGWTPVEYFHMIKVWAQANPGKEINIWFDSFADQVDLYFRRVHRQFQDDPATNFQEKFDNFQGSFRNRMYRFLRMLGGHKPMGDFIGTYLSKLKESLDDNEIKKVFDESLTHITDVISTDLIAEGIDLKEYFVKRNKDVLEDEVIEKYEYIQSFFGDYNFIISHDGCSGLITVKDFHAHAGDFDEDMYALYLFEMLFNRDTVLNRNLLLLLIGSKSNGFVMPANRYPTLNEILQPFINDGALGYAIERMTFPGSPFKSECSPEMFETFHSVNCNEVFIPLPELGRDEAYFSVNELDGIINYLAFPTGLDTAKRIFDPIYTKRAKQIEMLSIDIVEMVVNAVVGEKLNEKKANELKTILIEFRNEIFELYGTSNTEYVRQVAARSSHFRTHIYEISQSIRSSMSEIWGSYPKHLPYEDNSINLTPYDPTFEDYFINHLQDKRLKSDIDLEIFVYIHNGIEYLGHVRYPHFSKKGILFMYDGDATDNRIKFQESGIILPNKNVLTERDVMNHVQQVSSNGGKIRIHVMGHSMPNYLIIPTPITAIQVKREQYVGGQNVKRFNDNFIDFFNEYLGRPVIERVVFMACNLATFKNTRTKTLEFLPKDTFLEKFIDNFRSHGIRIKEVNASDAIVSVHPFVGRLNRLKTRDKRIAKKFPQEIRKLIINCEEEIPGSKLGKYKCKPIEYNLNITGQRKVGENPEFSITDDIFSNSVNLRFPEVLETPATADRVSNEIVVANHANSNGHFLLESDVTALVACAHDRNGVYIIASTIPEKIAGVQLAFRMAVEFNDFATWKSFLQAVFPETVKHIESFITRENYNQLLINVASSKILFTNIDLSKPLAHVNIQSYLAIQEGTNSIALINASNQENDISRTTLIEQLEKFTAEAGDFAVEKRDILAKRDLAFENYKDNISAMNERGDSIVIHSDKDNAVHASNWLDVRDEWNIHTEIIRNDLAFREAAHALTFSETYHMAKELQEAINDTDLLKEIPQDKLEKLVPLFDTLAVEIVDNVKTWSICFVDSASPEHYAVTVKTTKPIFEKVSNFIKRVSVGHITATGTTALNLIFAAQALCQWVEYGFRPSIDGISNKSLATAIEVHFYVNAVGVIQGLTESGILIGQVATNLAIRNALLIKVLQPYVKMSLIMAKASTTGRTLLSLGRFAGKALHVIGFVVNAADLGLNIFELVRNDDSAQRPVLITNTVFSSIGLAVSIAAIVATIVGATAWTGPLALVGLGIAVISIPITYFVVRFKGAIEKSKHVGKVIESIVKEIQDGAYQKHTDGNFLSAPSFIPVTELRLTANDLEFTYGRTDYLPSSTSDNTFVYQYANDYENSIDVNRAKVPIDETIRTIVMPHVPNFIFSIDSEWVPFAGSRHDAEFDMGRDLQHRDSGFTFQEDGFLGTSDKIASSFEFDYEHTNIEVNIEDSNWQMVFPWADTAHAENDDDKETLEASNKAIKSNLEYLTYYISAQTAGRQYISLPGLDCPVDIRLDASNKETTWFIQFTERTISEKQIKIERNIIKLGDNQTIEVTGDESEIYVVISKYEDPNSDFNGIAYFDVKKKVYFYNKDASKKQQECAVFLFDTKEYACFYLSKYGDTIWFVNNETKQLSLQFIEVKTFQKQGEGTIIVQKDGVICYVSKNLKTGLLFSQIYGINEDWFNKIGDPSQALSKIIALLKVNSHNPFVPLYLPHCKNDGNMINTHTWYYPEKEKYFVLDENYTEARFVSSDDQNACLHDTKQGHLIFTKLLDIEEFTKKIEIDEGRTYVRMGQNCAVLMRGVSNVYNAPKGLSIVVASGLELLLYKNDKSRYEINVHSFHLHNFDEQADFGDRILRDKSILESEIRKENLGDILSGVEIKRIFLVGIEYQGKIVGYSMDSDVGYICSAQFPNASRIRTLGHDNACVYHILDCEKVYQSDWVEHLSQIREGPEKSPTLLLDAEVVELFDQTIYVKSNKMGTERDFWRNLKPIGNLPEVEFIWMESSKYDFDFNSLENVTYSIDLSEAGEEVDETRTFLKFSVANFPDICAQRQNLDFCFFCPSTKTVLVLKGIFDDKYKSNVNVQMELSRNTEGMNIVDLSHVYSECIKQTISVFGRPLYPTVTIIDILEFTNRKYKIIKKTM